MKRILFVDDEPRVLEQLRQILEPQKGQWDMAFAQGGEAALMLLDATPFDVVVSDIAMPRMDGAALMKTICERYPAIVRIVLAAPQELGEALRAVPVAHQFLLKPCDPNMLRVAVERATSLSNILSNKLLANLVGSVKDLPVLPRTYMALRQKLAEPGIDPRRGAHCRAGRGDIRENSAAGELGVFWIAPGSLFGKNSRGLSGN